MIKALQEGWIAGAGLDVLEIEPIGHNNPLLGMDNVILDRARRLGLEPLRRGAQAARRRRARAGAGRQVAARLRQSDGAGEVQAGALAALLDGARPRQLRPAVSLSATAYGFCCCSRSRIALSALREVLEGSEDDVVAVVHRVPAGLGEVVVTQILARDMDGDQILRGAHSLHMRPKTTLFNPAATNSRR